ncbi:MAG: DegV family protein [Acholeplasmatales bacterium]|nr:DegV family protein [Acholeplasmatales bacterium]
MKTCIMTDSNSGITQDEGKKLGIPVVPMPFTINGKDYLEDINLGQEEFYNLLDEKAVVLTSQPSAGALMDLWKATLKEYDEIVYIPMSSGLSKSCETATFLSNEKEFKDKVFVVNNQRISVTQKQSVLDAMELAKAGKTAKEIKEILEATKLDSSIYITVDSIDYLRRGGRITAAAATFAKLLKIKPVLQIQGEKLDAFDKVRGMKGAKRSMLDQMKKDVNERFGGIDNVRIFVAYTADRQTALDFIEMVKEEIGEVVYCDPLSLSVSCHIGPGALAIACVKKLNY